jgi:RNA polymerase sigma-70 factor (TIGR02957 family)
LTTDAAYEELRPRAFAIAYRMLGSVSEAEDVVQEALLRLHRAEEPVESPPAFLATVTTRLAIDQLRSARVRRERYVGSWLPEPLLTSGDEVSRKVELSDSLTQAFLVLLEVLTPVERAVFLLREVFEYEYEEIARIVDRTEDNCRQLARRARLRVEEGRPRFETSREEREQLAERFFDAAERGEVEALERVLAADAVAYGDGGGKAPAIAAPIHGAKRVARLVASLFRQAPRMGLRLRRDEVNGQPGLVIRDREERIVGVFAIDVAAGAVQAVRSQVNPDKLGHLGELADIQELLRERSG